MKFEYTVVYENSSDKFDIEHCGIKVTAGVQKFPHLPQARSQPSLRGGGVSRGCVRDPSDRDAA